MKRDLYLDKYIRLLEQNAARAYKDLDRERKRVDFLEGKVERLELVVMAAKSDAGREYVDRTDRVLASPPIRKPPVTAARTDTKLSFSEIRSKWNSLSPDEQAKAVKDADLVVEPKGSEA